MYQTQIRTDRYGRLRRQIRVTPTKSKVGLGGFPCQTLCNRTFHRPHLGCMKCQARRAYMKKRSHIELVGEYRCIVKLEVAKPRTVLGKVRSRICRFLWSLAEVIGNW